MMMVPYTTVLLLASLTLAVHARPQPMEPVGANELRQMRIQADASTLSFVSEESETRLVRQQQVPKDDSTTVVVDATATAVGGEKVPIEVASTPATEHEQVKDVEAAKEIVSAAGELEMDADKAVAAVEPEEKVAALHSRTECQDIPFDDQDGFGCDAYYVLCSSATDVADADVPTKVRESCCICGGGESDEGKRFAIGKMKMDVEGESKDHPCQWVVADNGEHVWDCDKDGVFLLCGSEAECQTANSVHMLGSDGWLCHIAHGMSEGMCIPPKDEPQLKVVQTTPDAAGHSFFSVNLAGKVEVVNTVGVNARQDLGHPCCCADKVPTTAAALLEAVATDMRQSPVEETLSLEKRVAGDLKNELDKMAGLEVEEEKKPLECGGITCKADSCPSAPPVTVVEFQLTSGNGVGYTTGSLDMMREKDHCTKELGGGPCVAVREENGEGETLSWDDRENVVQMLQLETTHQAPPDPTLPKPIDEKMPDIPECEAMGGHCETEVMSYVLFLIDMSGSTNKLARELVAKDIGKAYSQLCTNRDGTKEFGVEAGSEVAEDIPGHKQCAMYGFDGSAHLMPITPFEASMSPLSAEEVEDVLLRYETLDNSTNLVGALISAEELLMKQKANNMTAYTVVLVTDGHERTHRYNNDLLAKASLRHQESKVDTYVMLVTPGHYEAVAKQRAAKKLGDDSKTPALVLANPKDGPAEEEIDAEEKKRRRAAHRSKAEYWKAVREWRGEHQQQSGQAFICLDLLGLPNAKCCTQKIEDEENNAARKCTAIEPPEDIEEEKAEVKRNLDAEGARLQHASTRLAATVAADNVTSALDEESDKEEEKVDKVEAESKEEHHVAQAVAQAMRSKHRRELAEVNSRISEWKEKKTRALSTMKARQARNKLAKAQFEEDTKRMMESWQKHLVVQQSLFAQSHYLVAFCSSFRAGIKQTNERLGELLVSTPTATSSTRFNFDFSSATFRNPHCSHKTLMSALGKGVDDALLGTEPSEPVEPSFPAPAPPSPVPGPLLAAQSKVTPKSTKATKAKSGSTLVSPAVLPLFALIVGVSKLF